MIPPLLLDVKPVHKVPVIHNIMGWEEAIFLSPLTSLKGSGHVCCPWFQDSTIDRVPAC